MVRVNTLYLTDVLRTLADASEKIGWPMRIDYLSTSSEAREHFKKAFLNLLKLQSLSVEHLAFVYVLLLTVPWKR